MTLSQLEVFVAVVEEESFTKAADRVFRTQPAVSLAVKKLEDEVGVPLLARDGQVWTLTEAGERMLEYARRIVSLCNEAERDMAQFSSLTAGSVGIAAHESGVQYILPDPIAAFHKRFPHIKIQMRHCGVDEVGELVLSRVCELGFGVTQKDLGPLQSEVLFRDPHVLVVPPDHNLAKKEKVRMQDLEDEDFCVHHLHTETVNTIRGAFADHGVEFSVVAELWNFEAVKRFVQMGCGLAILPLSVIRRDAEAKRLTPRLLEDFNLPRPIEIIYHAREELLPGAAALLDLLLEWDWERQGSLRDGLRIVGSRGMKERATLREATEADDASDGRSRFAAS